jgi:crotonobetainyl-CoA:carnitine CoA-transferase CaiB-like acyl-CoA transferase
MLLSDVLVIDASNRFGWLAGRILADLGAEVAGLQRQQACAASRSGAAD